MTKDELKKTCCIFLLFYFRRIQTRNRNRNRIIVISNVFMLFFVWAHRIHLPLTHHIHMYECVAKRESCSKQFSLHEQNNRFSSDFHHSKSFEVLQSFHMPMLKPMLCSAHLSFALGVVLFCCIMIIVFPQIRDCHDQRKCDLNSLQPQATITTA